MIVDPVFGYRVELKRRGDVLCGEFWVEPGGGGAVEHIHPIVEERFHVLEGEFRFRVDGEAQEAGPGARLTVPKGTRHAFENSGEAPGRVLVEMEPAADMEALFRDSASLAQRRRWRRLGRRRAVPTGLRASLELAEFMQRYESIFVSTSPPRLLQRLIVPPAARLERRLQARRDSRAAGAGPA